MEACAILYRFSVSLEYYIAENSGLTKQTNMLFCYSQGVAKFRKETHSDIPVVLNELPNLANMCTL